MGNKLFQLGAGPQSQLRCGGRGWRYLWGLLCLTAVQAMAAGEPVTLQLKWSHAFQFAGYYAAKDLGYYQDAGLDVDIRAGGHPLDPVKEVVAGNAQYGVGTSSLLLARNQGQPVVVLAAIFQHSPLVLITRRDGPVQSVHDLVGKGVMLESQADELIAYLRHERVEVGSLRLLPHAAGIQALIDGKVDAISAYLSYEPYYLNKAKIPYQVFTPLSVGIDFYGDNLFTSEAELRQHPSRVEAFRTASLRGWRYAMAHPDEVVDLIVSRYAPGLEREFLLFEARRMAQLMQPDLIEVGYMYQGRWRLIADTYADLGLLPADFPLDQMLYSTNVEARLGRLSRYLLVALVVLTLVGSLAAYAWYANRRLARSLADLRDSQEALRQNESRYRTLTENMKDVVWVLDLERRRFTYVSPSVTQLRGYTPEEVMAQPLEAALTPESQVQVAAALAEQVPAARAGILGPKTYLTQDIEQPCKDGSRVMTEVIAHFLTNPITGTLELHGVTRDITERRRQEERIRVLAQHDPLTGLPNRALFSEHLAQALANAKRDRTRLALMFLDLDHFKPINDTHGHGVGDQVLQLMVARIQAGLRESDLVARIGGDEFVILVRSVPGAQVARVVAEKIRHSLASPFQIEGHALRLSCSIGIAIYPDQGDNEIELSRKADTAMYRAKQDGRDRVRVYDPQLDGASEAPSQLMPGIPAH